MPLKPKKGRAPEAPVQRDIDKEMSTMMKYIPQMYEAEAQAQLKYAPELQRVMTDSMIENAPRANRAIREADVVDLTELGPEMRAGLLGTNEQLQIMDRMTMDDLLLDGQLSAQEQRESDQAARAGMSARGLALSNPAVVQEVMNRDSMKRGRRNEARAASMNFARFTDPREMVLSRGGLQLAGQAASGGRLSGSLATQVPGAVQDVYGYNANAVNSHKINVANTSMANAAAQNQFTGGLISAGASIAGGAMAM